MSDLHPITCPDLLKEAESIIRDHENMLLLNTPTAKNMLAKMHERLGHARADLKRAELRGYNSDVDLGRVLMLAGLLATFDPTLAGDDGFIARMADVSDVD